MIKINQKNHSIVYLLLLLIFLGSCSTVNHYNHKIRTPISSENLKFDIDFAYGKLQKIHPNLYQYISKQELERKFDSLKARLDTPMTSKDFYFQLSPVISSVRQGHIRLIPLTEKLNPKEKSLAKKLGKTPLSQFEYEIIENRLIISENNSPDSTIHVGSEVIAVNNITPEEIFSKYRNTFSSDGYNTTFINKRLSDEFPFYFYFENGICDSVNLLVKYNDTIFSKCISRVKKTHGKKDNDQSKIDKREKIIGTGFDRKTNSYRQQLTFPSSDSSIAMMKIKNFSDGNFSTFFHKSFKFLKRKNIQYLILDLRDNPGGKIYSARLLYSYLTNSNYYFLDRFEVTSRTSILYDNYLKEKPFFVKALLVTVGLPFRLLYMAASIINVKKEENGKFYYKTINSNLSHPKRNNYKGKIYVLINGGTFSASCLISSNLSGSGRAIFVGKETGGAFNGNVAGTLPVFTLPKSGLKLRFGGALIQPHYKSENNGRGIMPDIEIKPTKEDIISGNDAELTRVLNEIKKVK